MTPAEQRAFAARQKAMRVNVNTQTSVNKVQSSVNAEVSGSTESRRAVGRVQPSSCKTSRQHESPKGKVDGSGLTSKRAARGQAGVAPSPLTSADNPKACGALDALMGSEPKLSDRHSLGYMAAYMRAYRARKNQGDT